MGERRVWQLLRSRRKRSMLALFSVAAPSGPLRAGNAPSAVSSVLGTSIVLVQPGEEPEVLFREQAKGCRDAESS